MSTLRDGLWVLLRIVAVLVCAAVALVLAVGVWMWQSKRSSESDARAFCAGIAIGEPVAEIDARADRNRVMYGSGPEGRRRYRFPGWGRGICEVEASEGRVTSRRAWYEAWD